MNAGQGSGTPEGTLGTRPNTVEFRLPDVGEGLSEGEILAWRVAIGDRVARDQAIVEVQTDKSVVELPAPVAGVVTELGGEVGDVLPVGAVLAVIATGDGPATPARQRQLASPATRKLALELGVDLQAVAGSGPGGRVTRQDVEQAAQAAREVPTVAEPAALQGDRQDDRQDDVEVVALRGLRRRIAQTMTQAWREIPHVTDLREVDATELVRARARLRARLEPEGVRLTFLPLFVKAVATALARHPALNASIDLTAGTVTYHRRRHIGIATATADGLIVPVLHDADRKSLAEIAREAAALAEAARARTVTPEQTAGGTFTITNAGSYGSRFGTPLIRPPEAAIAGFGRIHDAVVPVDGAPAVRPLLPLAVAADHRLIDGDVLGAFAADLAELLSDPVLLLA
ncbi:MAG: dihydrolipoamide acetyltransferase family protein [Egibacteraceae bacterium]